MTLPENCTARRSNQTRELEQVILFHNAAQIHKELNKDNSYLAQEYRSTGEELLVAYMELLHYIRAETGGTAHDIVERLDGVLSNIARMVMMRQRFMAPAA